MKRNEDNVPPRAPHERDQMLHQCTLYEHLAQVPIIKKTTVL